MNKSLLLVCSTDKDQIGSANEPNDCIHCTRNHFLDHTITDYVKNTISQQISTHSNSILLVHKLAAINLVFFLQTMKTHYNYSAFHITILFSPFQIAWVSIVVGVVNAFHWNHQRPETGIGGFAEVELPTTEFLLKLQFSSLMERLLALMRTKIHPVVVIAA